MPRFDRIHLTLVLMKSTLRQTNPMTQMASVVLTVLIVASCLLLASATTALAANGPLDKTSNLKTITPQEIQESVDRSVDWLLDFCIEAPPVAAGAGNDSAKQAVVLFQTAFLLEMMPELFNDDPRREKVLAKADKRLDEGAGRNNLVFSSWVNGFVTIYALEKSSRSGSLHPALQSLAQSWIDRQNPEGGWSHGASGRIVAIYPSTILSASNFALLGLGAIKEFDHELQNSADFKDVVEEAIAMYEKSQSSRGGLPYGARSYQKGVQSGRTATSLTGMVALGLADSELFCRAVHYSVANVKTVPFGHASPAMHIGCGGLAFAMLGGDHWQQYQRHHFQRLLNIQNKDGTFGDFAGNGPDSFIGNQKISAAYRTALYTICLKADQSHFIKRLQKRFDVSKTLAKGEQLILADHPNPPVEAKTMTAQHHLDLETGEQLLELCQLDSRLNVAIRSSDGKEIRWVDVESGRTSERLKLDNPLGASDIFRTREKLAVIVTFPKVETPNLQVGGGAIEQSKSKSESKSESLSNDKQKSVVGIEAHGFDIGTGKKAWSQKLSPFRTFQFRQSTADFLSTTGKTLRRFDLKTGEVVFTSPTVGEVTSATVFGFDEGASFVGGMGKLVKHDELGELDWKSRMRGKRGMIQPSAISMIVIDDQIFVSTSNAFIFCFDTNNGKLNWKLETDGLVKLLKNENDQLFAMGENGTVHSLADLESQPKLAWSTNIGNGLEVKPAASTEASSHNFRCVTTSDKLIAHDRIENKFYVLDANSGKFLSKGNADMTSYSSGHLATMSGDTIKIFDLQ